MNKFLLAFLSTFFISGWASSTDSDGLGTPELMAQLTGVPQGVAQQEVTVELDDEESESVALPIVPLTTLLTPQVIPSIGVVYHDQYGAIGITGFNRMFVRSFDIRKWRRMAEHMARLEIPIMSPGKIADRPLLAQIHTDAYLDKLFGPKLSSTIDKILETGGVLSLVPSSIVRKRLFDPMLWMVEGTIRAAHLAMDCGFAIHCGGGMHHAMPKHGEGFCVIADISLAIVELRKRFPGLRVLYVDTDVHRGNGVDFIHRTDHLTMCFDIYNRDIYPGTAPKRVDKTYDFPLSSSGRSVNDDVYMSVLMNNLPAAIASFKPQLIIHNAGVDVHEIDPLGGFGVSTMGVIQRDAYIAMMAKDANVPLVMLPSGGYTQLSAIVQAMSFENIIRNILGMLEPEPTTSIMTRVMAQMKGKP